MNEPMQFEINQANLKTDVILEALNDVLTASEADFQGLKEKTWYKRLWGMVTFSKDNEKRLASGVANLAKLQDIVIKLVMQLSRDDKQIAQAVLDNQVQINELAGSVLQNAQEQQAVNQRLKLLEQPTYQRLEFLSLLPEHQYIIVSALRKLLVNTGGNEHTQKYMQHIHEHSCLRDLGGREYEYRNIDGLAPAEQALLYHMVRELLVLQDLDDVDNAAQEILRHIAISPNKQEIVNREVDDTRAIEGMGFLTKPLMEYEPLCIETDGLEFIQMDEAEWVEESDDEEFYQVDKDESDKIDESLDCPYQDCRKIIAQSILEVFPKEGARQKKQSKNREMFRAKFMPTVISKTMVYFAQGSKTKCAFTTSGIYLMESSEKEPHYLAYREVDFDKTAFLYGETNGKIEKVLVHTKEGVPYTISDSGIDLEKFVELLRDITDVDTAETDKAIPIAEMPPSVKAAYGFVLLTFCKMCRLEPVDALRRMQDATVTDELFQQMRAYSECEEVWSTEVDLDTIRNEAPYPSEESVSYSLIADIVSMIQFSTQVCRELTVVQREQIKIISRYYGVEDDLLEKVISNAQIPYRILKKDISEKEVKEIVQGLLTVAVGAGLPIITLAGANFLFWNTFWFWFIPGVGTILSAAALGVAATTVVAETLNSKKSKGMTESYEALMTDLVKSYMRLADATSLEYALCAAYKADETLGALVGLQFPEDEDEV